LSEIKKKKVRIRVPAIEDKTTDPRVPLWLRRYVYKICEEVNREEKGKEPALIITEFEIKIVETYNREIKRLKRLKIGL